jgi:hypothetical protein
MIEDGVDEGATAVFSTSSVGQLNTKHFLNFKHFSFIESIPTNLALLNLFLDGTSRAKM